MKIKKLCFPFVAFVILLCQGCIVWDELTIGKVKDIISTITSKFGGYNGLFSNLQNDFEKYLDKTVKVKAEKLTGSEAGFLNGTPLRKYIPQTYLQDDGHLDPWRDIWQNGQTPVDRYPALQDDAYGYLTANKFYQSSRDYKEYADNRINEEKEYIKEMQQDASALGDIRKWQIEESRKVEEWEGTALKYASAKDNPADSLQLALQITLEMENIMQVSQSVALQEMELVQKIKARIRELDSKHHYSRLLTTKDQKEATNGK